MVVALPDIRPAAAVHLLILPKAHIPNVSSLSGADAALGETAAWIDIIPDLWLCEQRKSLVYHPAVPCDPALTVAVLKCKTGCGKIGQGSRGKLA